MAADNALRLAFILSATDKMSRIIDQAVKKSTDKLSSFERTTSKVGRSMVKSGAGMTAAGVAVGAAVLTVGKSTADYAGSVKDMSEATGIGTEAWQKMTYAAKISGIESEKLATSMVKFDKLIADAASGSKTAGQVFKDLGIKIKDAGGNMRKPNEIFEDIAAIFARTEDGATKTALACQFFGKSGAELMPMLNEGKEGLLNLYEAAVKSGNVLGNESLEACDVFGKKMDSVSKQIQGVALTVGASLMPMLQGLVNKFSDTIQKVTDWMQANPQLVQTIGKIAVGVAAVLVPLGVLSVIIGSIVFVSGKFMTAWRGVATAMKVGKAAMIAAKNSMLIFRVQYAALVVWQKLAAVGQWLFNTALSACPIVWIIAGIAAVIAAVVLLVKHWGTITAFFSRVWAAVKQVFKAAWDWIKNMFLNYTPHGLIIKHWDSIVDWFVNLWNKVGAVFSGLGARFYEWGRNMIVGLWDGIKSMVNNLIESVRNIGRKIANTFKSFFGINSPSRLFMSYGMNITQGLTGGLEAGGSAVEQATEGLGVQATRGAEKAMMTNTSNTSHAVNTMGGVSVSYAPNITIQGNMSEDAKQDFVKMLRQHRDEIVDIMRRETQNRERLSFA